MIKLMQKNSEDTVILPFLDKTYGKIKGIKYQSVINYFVF